MNIHNDSVFNVYTHTHTSAQTWIGAAAHLPTCLCGVLTLLVASSCAVGQIAAAFCRRGASWARGSGSAAARLP